MDISRKEMLDVSSRAVCDVYLAGSSGRIQWPYRLERGEYSQPSVRRHGLKHILDSGFSEGNAVPNDELIEMARERRPDYVIPNDTLADPDEGIDRVDAIRETAAKVADFLDRVDEVRLEGDALGFTTLIPLQPPYQAHFALLCEEYPRQARRSHFALGGLKGTPPAVQVGALWEARQVIGWGAYLHGLGLAVASSPRMIRTLRETPRLLDSVDTSTPIQRASNGFTAGVSRKKQYVQPASGGETSTALAKLTEFELMEISRHLAPGLTDAGDLALSDRHPHADLDTGFETDPDPVPEVCYRPWAWDSYEAALEDRPAAEADTSVEEPEVVDAGDVSATVRRTDGGHERPASGGTQRELGRWS